MMKNKEKINQHSSQHHQQYKKEKPMNILNSITLKNVAQRSKRACFRLIRNKLQEHFSARFFNTWSRQNS